MNLLTRHFLRRFLDNDLISPHADRHEPLANIGGALVAISLIVSLLMSMKYLSQVVQLPGLSAVLALSDRFVFIGASMAVTALATLLVWDALALELRDTLILGPLPITPAAIVRAKLAAMLVFVSGFALLINVVPAFLSPIGTTIKLRIPLLSLARLIAVHWLAVSMAALTVFFVVLGVRSLLELLLPRRLLARVSVVAQSVLLFGAVTALLLLPMAGVNVARDWLRPNSPSTFVSPLWFLGVYETAGGDVVAGAPLDNPHHYRIRQTYLDAEILASARYAELRPVFDRLSSMALASLAGAAAVAIGAFLWNSRRLPMPAVPRARSARLRAMRDAAAYALAPRRQSARAGFFFAWHSLTRNGPHRLSLASALAVGVSAAVIGLNSADAWTAGRLASTAILAAQTLVLIAMVIGLRHAVRVPAELAANWAVRLAWDEDPRPYIMGVKRAGFLLLVVIPVAALSPLPLLALGWRAALAHAAFGLLLGRVLIDAMFFTYSNLPFVCCYSPTGQLKFLIPAVVAGCAIFTLAIASIERAAFTSCQGTLTLLLTLAAAMALLAIVDRRRRRPAAVGFDDAPEFATQRLGLLSQ